MMPPAVPPIWSCPRRTGFLFPHPCERLTAVGCPDCHDGQFDDPYNQRRSDWGMDPDDDDGGDYQASAGSQAGDGPEDATPDLTEADGEALVNPEDSAFESDMGAS
jgi:hypothetical protein